MKLSSKIVLMITLIYLTLPLAAYAVLDGDTPEGMHCVSLSASIRNIQEINRYMSVVEAEAKVESIDEIMRSVGGFIQLPHFGFKNVLDRLISLVKPGKIAASPVTQKLWVEVVGKNPSHFKDRLYCPNDYEEVNVSGTRVEMCPNFPVDSVYDYHEFLNLINKVYRRARILSIFRIPSVEEYDYADTNGGTEAKTSKKVFAGQYSKSQARSVFENTPNSLGFRKGGILEWTSDEKTVSIEQTSNTYALGGGTSSKCVGISHEVCLVGDMWAWVDVEWIKSESTSQKWEYKRFVPTLRLVME